MTSATEKQINIIIEPVLKSWLRDAGMLALALGLVVPGWFMQSSAMQWLGVIIFFTSIMIRSGGERLGIFKCRSFAEARAKLDELEGRAQ